MVHPNVVRFVECFEDNKNVYMIIELCSNKVSHTNSDIKQVTYPNLSHS